MPSPWVVVPTYNERANIEGMVRALFGLDVENLSVLIVDDASPDGTSAVSQCLQREFSRLHILNRRERLGLGTAYISGFSYALAHGADGIVQMDADFSHSPADVPRLLEKLATCDVVIGSRYYQGVSIVNWPVRRLLLSVAGNWYARLVTGLPYRDVTGGFRAWRTSAIQAINPKTIRADGYGFQVAIAHRAWKLGLSVVEVPIIFYERRDGQSKLTKGIMWETFWLVWRLRLWAAFKPRRRHERRAQDQRAQQG